MARKLRLTCPGCQTKFEVGVESDGPVQASCPSCSKRLTVKAPAAPKPLAPSRPVTPARPVAPARPVTPIVVARPAAPTPAPQPTAHDPTRAGAHRTNAPHVKAHAPAVPNQPTVANASFDELYNAPTSYAPTNYGSNIAPAYMPRKRSSNKALKTALIAGSSVLGVCVLLGIVYYAYSYLQAAGGVQSLSMIGDSHQRLIEDFIRDSETAYNERVSQIGTGDVEHMRSSSKAMGARAERLLIRAVCLGKAPVELKTDLDTRMKALSQKAEADMKARMQEVQASGQDTVESREAQISKAAQELFLEKDFRGIILVSSAMQMMMSNVLFDVPAPQNEIETIYYDEIEQIREFLKILATINSQSQLKQAVPKIEALAERSIELAARRSDQPRKIFDSVPREYVRVADMSDKVRDALVFRIERDLKPTEEFKDSLDLLKLARVSILEAASGSNSATIRKRFADARELMAKQPNRTPAILAAPEAPREMASKASRPRTPEPPAQQTPEEQTPRAQTPPAQQTAQNTAPSNTTKPTLDTANNVANNSVNSTASPNTTTSNSGMGNPTAQSSPTNSPKPDDSSVANNSQGGQATPTPSAPSTSAPSTSTSANEPVASNSAGSPMAPNRFPRFGPFGPPGFGDRGMPPGMNDAFPNNGSNTNSSPPPNMFGNQGPPAGFTPPDTTAQIQRFSGPTGVVIYLTNNKRDANQLATRLRERLKVSEFFMNASNDTAVIGLRYSGDLKEVIALIDFGTVTETDNEKRIIRIKVDNSAP